jgi:hypothetical protein
MMTLYCPVNNMLGAEVCDAILTGPSTLSAGQERFYRYRYRIARSRVRVALVRVDVAETSASQCRLEGAPVRKHTWLDSDEVEVCVKTSI